MNGLSRGAVVCLLLEFMLLGCQSSPSSSHMLNLEHQSLASVTQAPEWAPDLIGGMYPLGNPNTRYASASYTSADFQRLGRRVEWAYSVLSGNPRSCTAGQLYTLTGAVADLVRYVDAIDAAGEGRASTALPEGEGLTAPDGLAPSSKAKGGSLAQSGAAGIKQAMIARFTDMAGDDALRPLRSPGAQLLDLVERQLASMEAREVVSSAPLIGLLLAEGMLAEGRALDGSVMSEVDYSALKAAARPGPAVCLSPSRRGVIGERTSQSGPPPAGAAERSSPSYWSRLGCEIRR